MMNKDVAKSTMIELFSRANVRVGGDRPWDIRVLNDKFYARVLLDGTIGAGETYVEKYWVCDRLDEFFDRILRTSIEDKIGVPWRTRARILMSKVFNFQTQSKAYTYGQAHYDLDNAFFQNMLDKRMVYTCAFWDGANSLDEAQENKLHLVCKKLNLQPGMHVLDIGCGWGSFAKFAAENYGVQVTGITVAKEQVKVSESRCNGLPVQILLKDYRE